MIKYIKYYFPLFLLCSFLFISLLGTHYPTIYFLCFSILIIFGDIIFPRDKKIEKFSYTFLLDLSIYLALPMIFIFIFYVISIFSSVLPEWYLNFFNFFNINFYELKNSFTLVDKISIIVQTKYIIVFFLIIFLIQAPNPIYFRQK